jgi:hypothetical protein
MRRSCLFSTLNVSFPKFMKHFRQNLHWGNFQENLTSFLTGPVTCASIYSSSCPIAREVKLEFYSISENRTSLFVYNFIGEHKQGETF